LTASEQKTSDSIVAIDERINDVSTAILETRGDLSKAIHDDMNEMVNRINASLEEMQVKIDDYEGSMEAVKIRISDTDVSNRARLQQVSDTLQASIAEHAITLFSERLQEVPRQLQVAEEQYEDFRRKLLEFNRTDSEKLNQLLGSMRESFPQRILSQQEMEQVTAEQTRLRIQEVEAMTRERHRELKAAQERAMEDQLITMRVMKEASSFHQGAVSPVSVKLERIYHEVDELKYASERMKAEIKSQAKKEKFAQDSIVNENGNRAGSGGNYYKPDFGKERNLRTESPRVNYQEPLSNYILHPPTKHNTKNIQANLQHTYANQQPRNWVTHLQKKSTLTRQSFSSPLLQSEAQPPQDYLQVAPKIPPHGPTQILLSRREATRRHRRATQLKNFVRGSDPELERLADLALAGSSLPPLPRKPSFGGGNAEF
ncbi:hypothetical protein BC829DRAFT_399796, partial [Chytridium lagenaria]